MLSSMLNYNRLNLYVLIVTSLLLAVGCDCGCKRKQLEYEQDKTLFEITTTRLNQIGGIGPNLPILYCEGEIAINKIINDDLQLCALVIPTGINVKDAIEEANSIGLSFDNDDQGKRIDLVNSNGTACYIKPLTSGVKGIINANLTFSNPLATGKHVVYLFVPTESHGTYYSLQGQEFEIKPANVATDPSIILRTAPKELKAENIKGSSNVQITAITEVINYDGDYTGGFLFIEESSTQTVIDILNKQIEKKASFSYNPDFQLLDGNPEVIICSFQDPKIDDWINSLLEKKDNAALFERKKYKAYGYIYNLVTNVYTISQEGQLVMPPLSQAELTVTGDFNLYFSARYLPQDGSGYAKDPELNSTELRGCSLCIDKNVSIANDSKIGFLFVNDSIATDPEALKDYINDTEDSELEKGEFCNPASTNDVVVYTLDKVNNGIIGNFTVPGDALVQEGKPMFEVAKYRVYAWLQNSEAIDGKKEVFISAAAKEFTIDLGGFQEFAKLTEFRTKTQGANGMIIKNPNPGDGSGLVGAGTFSSNYNNLAGNKKMIGYIVCRGGNGKPTLKGLLSIVGSNIDEENGNIVNCPKKKDGKFEDDYPGHFSLGQCLYLTHDCHYGSLGGFYNNPSLHAIPASIWLVVANERSVAVTMTGVDFTYLRAAEEGEKPVKIENASLIYNYEVKENSHWIARIKKAQPDSVPETIRWQGIKFATTRDKLEELANHYDHNYSIYECLNKYYNNLDKNEQLKDIIGFIQAMN